MSLLNWNDKKNSALLADFIAKHGAEYCMTAEEINQMRDAVNEMAVIQQSTFMGTAEPVDTPAGTGNRYWTAVSPGTYTNFGGVVVTANSLAIISVSAAGVYRVSQATLNLNSYKKITDNVKIETWNAKVYLSGDQVNYLGKDWVSAAATVAGDVPGNSSKWVERLTALVSKTDLTGVLNLEQAPLATGDGFIGNDGNVASSSTSWKYSDYLKCNESDLFDINAFGHPVVNSISFYDKNFIFISGKSVISGDYLISTVSAPVGTVYFRISFGTTASTGYVSSFILHYNTVSEIVNLYDKIKEEEGDILNRNLKINLLQNRTALQYFDYLQGGYPNATDLANAQLPIFFKKTNGIIVTDIDFFHKNNVTYRTFSGSVNESSGYYFDLGYTELVGVSYFEFKIKFPSSTNKSTVGFSINNAAGGRKTYFYNGSPYVNQQTNTDVSNVAMIYESKVGENIIQTWRFTHNLNFSVSTSTVLSIAHYSEGDSSECWFGDFICSKEPIKNNVIYVDKPTMNNSQYIGKNIMLFGDSNLRVSIGSTMIKELGCNVFINADGGRAMRFRDVGAVSPDLNWLYHWDRRTYVKSLKEAGVDIDSFIFFTSYNDTSGGGEISYAKIADVENNYPVLGDSSGVITSKLALFNALTDAQKAVKFDYQQTFCAYLKQLIDLYPLASIYLNEMLYSPAGSTGGVYTEDTTIQRDNDKSIRDSINAQINTISDWFGIPVLKTGKNVRYYYGNMTEYTSDTIHFDFRIGKKIGFYVSKKLLENL